MAEIDKLLSSQAKNEMQEYEAFIAKVNTMYTQLSKSVDTLKGKTRNLGKSEKDLTELEKERIRVKNQTKKVFTQALALEEKGTKRLILGQERLKIARKKAREEAQKALGVTKKSGGLFRSMTKSILTAGAAMLSFNAVVQVAGKIMKQVFLGTQTNIDFFRVKLAGLRGQFAVLTDRAANFGQTVVKQMNEGDGQTKKFAKAFARLNPIALLVEGSFKASKLVFKGTFEEMERVGNATEELERRLIELEKSTADINLRNAVRRRDIQELIFLTRDETVSYEDRMQALQSANKIEKEILKTQEQIQRERVAVLLAQETITDEQIAQIAQNGVQLEQVGLTLSVEEDRQNAITEITKLYEFQTLSLAKQRELLNRVNELTTKKLNTEKQIKTARAEETKIDETVTQKKVVAGEKQLTINQEQLDIQAEQLKKNLQYEEDLVKESYEKRQQIKDAAFQAGVELVDTLFTISQNQRDAELQNINAEYQAKITAAEGNKERQEALQKELEEKQAAIRQRQFQADKNQALFKIALNTAMGITAALTSIPPNVPLSIAVGVIGALQAAAVASKPIPAFFDGTSDTPFEYTAGEKGSELKINKDGSVELTPDRTTLYRGKEHQHATIIPSAPTQKILAENGLSRDPEMIKELRLTRKAIEGNNTNIMFSRNVGKLNKKYLKRKHKWVI